MPAELEFLVAKADGAAKSPSWRAGMEINGRTRLLGIIGHPVAHSLSPAMHNAAFAADGKNFAYLAMDVRPEELGGAVDGLRALGFAGFNVTMPHKERVLPLLDDVDEVARISGAVNTVVMREKGLHGMNTDGSGFIEACSESGVGFGGKRILVLGAGGAAAAVGTAILGQTPASVILMNRTHYRAEELAEKLSAVNELVEVTASPLKDKAARVAEADVVVNTTYLGMKDGEASPVPDELLRPELAVCDAVYRRGGETELIRLARKRGARVVPGDRMLLYQGVQAQRVWTGLEPNVKVMSDAVAR